MFLSSSGITYISHQTSPCHPQTQSSRCSQCNSWFHPKWIPANGKNRFPVGFPFHYDPFLEIHSYKWHIFMGFPMDFPWISHRISHGISSHGFSSNLSPFRLPQDLHGTWHLRSKGHEAQRPRHGANASCPKKKSRGRFAIYLGKL